MELKGTRAIGASTAEVWSKLNDPDTLQACIPGCEAIERLGEDEYRITIVVALGPVKARFKGILLRNDVRDIESFSLGFKGDGGPAGFANGRAQVTLRADGVRTVLNYHANSQVGGKLMQLGARLLDSTARKLTESFFDRFERMLSSHGLSGV